VAAAQAAAEEAQAREAATARKLLTKEAEIGSLKGEVRARVCLGMLCRWECTVRV